MSFTVYRSSAGSGKTFTLVREYLKIVLQNPEDFRRILAITFTNKAANEMKDRVLRELRGLADVTTDPDNRLAAKLMPLLMHDTRLTREQITGRATEALSLILHHYSEFSIGTIDSFAHRVVRAFAHDFGLPVSFNVELQADELLKVAVDLVLERVGSDQELTRLLVAFLESRIDEDRSWNIDRLLVSWAHSLLDEEGQYEIRKLRSLFLDDFRHAARQISGKIKAFETKISGWARSALDLIDGADIPYSAFYQGARGIKKYFENLAAGRFTALDPNSYIRTTTEEDRWLSKQASPREMEALAAIKPRLQDLYGQIQSARESEGPSYALFQLLSRAVYPMAVLHEISQAMEGFKRQRNLVHISEFNTRIARIALSEPVPFIYERLGEKYQHILIDEFQDTSRLQWHNLTPLVENALAGGYFNLVVGDGKQAIYRWRDGDVTQFSMLPSLPGSSVNRVVKQREQVLTDHYREQILPRNYRSGEVIVDFNNRFFRWISGLLAPDLQDVYKTLEQDVKESRPGGYISIEFLPGEQENASIREITCNRIRQILEEGKAAGYRFRDMAVLCRKNEQAGIIARDLILQQIPVVSAESLLLSYSPEIRFITGFISILSGPADPVQLASLVSYLFHRGYMNAGTLDDLLNRLTSSTHPGEQFFSMLNQNGMPIVPEDLLTLPLYDLCEELIRRFSLHLKPDPYLQFFLDAVVEFTGKEGSDISGFTGWWEREKNRRSIVVPEAMDAVRILTIHKAKGLQFPVVIFPFAHETRRLSRDTCWVDLPPETGLKMKTACLRMGDDLEKTIFSEMVTQEQEKSFLDLVNLLYVVMTRPEDRLYVLTTLPAGNQEKLQSLPALFSGFPEIADRLAEGENVVSFGDPSRRISLSEPTVTDVRSLEKFPSADWRNKIRIRPRAPEFWNMDDPSGKLDQGNVVHSILSSVISEGDVNNAITQAILSGMIAKAEEPVIREMLIQVVSHPQLSRCFSSSVQARTEAAILVPGGQTWRPDRVVFDRDEVIVLEYKTGKQHPWHREQLQHYRTLLQDMGYRKVILFLVYLYHPVEVLAVL